MNPTVQVLNPKLQETYNRVMGTELPQRPSTPPVVAHTAAPAAPAQAATVPSPTTAHGTSKKGLPWWIYLIVGAVFFGLYAFFWLRFFSLA